MNWRITTDNSTTELHYWHEKGLLNYTKVLIGMLHPAVLISSTYAATTFKNLLHFKSRRFTKFPPYFTSKHFINTKYRRFTYFLTHLHSSNEQKTTKVIKLSAFFGWIHIYIEKKILNVHHFCFQKYIIILVNYTHRVGKKRC